MNKNDLEVVSLKSCPRCVGDLHTNRDMYGHYKECLQCGYMLDINKISPSGLDVSRGLKDKNNDISVIKLNELRISLSAAEVFFLYIYPAIGSLG